MSPKIIAVLTICVLLVAGGGYYLVSTTRRGTEEPRSKEFDLRIAERRIVDGPKVLRVRQNDAVTIHIASDEAEEFHLHGYDRSVDIGPDKAATLSFTASASGNFVFELEGSKTEIGTVEVLP